MLWIGVITASGGAKLHQLPDIALNELRAAVGSNNVVTSSSVLQQHDHDESWHHPSPAQAVVYPESVQHVSAVAKCCNKHHIPMVPFGTGTGLEGGVCAVRVSFVSVYRVSVYRVSCFYTVYRVILATNNFSVFQISADCDVLF